MKCPNCNNRLTDERIRSARAKNLLRGRENDNIYCNRRCFRMYKSKHTEESKTCGECGEVKPFRIHTNAHGVKRCPNCVKLAVCNRRLDSEVKALVILNPGAGFDYFIDTVFGTNRTTKGRAMFRSKLTEFLMDLQECEGGGVDYIGWLQNPDTMLTMSQDRVPVNMTKYIRGQRRSSVSNSVQNTKITRGIISAEDARIKNQVKIPPKFRWGQYKPR